jgi:hypothetical protein
MYIRKKNIMFIVLPPVDNHVDALILIKKKY